MLSANVEGFLATFTCQICHLPLGQLIFDYVKYNVGNHYSASTGTFTTPKDGYYLVTVHLTGQYIMQVTFAWPSSCLIFDLHLQLWPSLFETPLPGSYQIYRQSDATPCTSLLEGKSCVQHRPYKEKHHDIKSYWSRKHLLYYTSTYTAAMAWGACKKS